MLVQVWFPGEQARSTTRPFFFPDDVPFTLEIKTFDVGTLLGYAEQLAAVVMSTSRILVTHKRCILA